MRKVKIAYSPDSKKVGKELELEDDEAGLLVREGRAAYVDTDTGDNDESSNTGDASSSRAKKTAATAAKADPTAEVAKK